jgi:hypothetical protein
MPVRDGVIVNLAHERAKRLILARRAYYAAMAADAPWSALQYWADQWARYARRADLSCRVQRDGERQDERGSG